MNQAKEIRTQHEILVLFGSPTEKNWLGIANATKRLFPLNNVEIPQWYSHPKLTSKEIERLCNEIIQLKFDKVIISGFADYFYQIIDLLHAHTPIQVIYHGTMNEWHDSQSKWMIERLIEYGQTKKIKKIGFIKMGLAGTFSTLYDIPSAHLILPTPIPNQPVKKIQLDDSKIHVGIFGADTFNKNLHQQVVLALEHPDTIVHVGKSETFDYLNQMDRIIGHGDRLNQEYFQCVLGSMDINMHLSFSESWGQIVTESLALGVPCFTAYNSDVYDRNKELGKLLHINDLTNLNFQKRFEMILNDKENISSICKLYVQDLNVISVKCIQDFTLDTPNF